MKQELKGFLKIFLFTFRQHVKSRGYLLSGIGIGLLCLILPVAIMTFMGMPEGDSREPGETWEETLEAEEAPEAFSENKNIHNIYVVDQMEANVKEGSVSDWYTKLNAVGDPRFPNLSYEAFSDVETAAKTAKGSGDTLILVVSQGTWGQALDVLLPENTSLSEEDAADYESFLESYFQVVQIARAGISQDVLSELYRPVELQVISGSGNASGLSTEPDTEEDMSPEEEQEVPLAALKDILSMVLPYVTIMVLYFMILAYGQGVAGSVIMEKNSKLMDTFLVMVKPGAMIMGKVLAICASGLIQLFLWAACLAASFAAGTAVVKFMDPETDMLVIQMFDTFGQMSTGLFSVTGVLFTILILVGGFLLYCALAAVGGAIAGKPEDLSTTNILFTMALVISFLLALYGGALQGELASGSWMLYMPFTAILVAPGMALLGELTVMQCLISLIVILFTALIIILAAGRIYKILVFHKGEPVSVQKALVMLVKKQ